MGFLSKKVEQFEDKWNETVDTEAIKEETDKFKKYAESEAKKIHIISLVGSICVGKVSREITKQVLKKNKPEDAKGLVYTTGERLITDLVTGGSIIFSYKEIEKWREKFAYISKGEK